MLCLQETKWKEDDIQNVREAVGAKYMSYVVLTAIGTAGGVLLAWDANLMTLVDKQVGVYTLSVDLMVNIDTSVLRVTGVYGPSNQRDKFAFFEELKEAKSTIAMPLMVAGDFNVTLNLQDRSNLNHHVNQMRGFRGLIEQLELIDLPLHGRRYTWSNERENPTFVRLDKFLVSTEWIHSFSNTVQTA